MSTDAQSPEDFIETMCKQVSLLKRSILRGFILVAVGLKILDYGQLPVTSDRMVGGKSGQIFLLQLQRRPLCPVQIVENTNDL